MAKPSKPKSHILKFPLRLRSLVHVA